MTRKAKKACNQVFALRPDLFAGGNDCVAVTLTCEPLLSAHEVIDILDAAAAEYAAEREYQAAL